MTAARAREQAILSSYCPSSLMKFQGTITKLTTCQPCTSRPKTNLKTPAICSVRTLSLVCETLTTSHCPLKSKCLEISTTMEANLKRCRVQKIVRSMARRQLSGTSRRASTTIKFSSRSSRTSNAPSRSRTESPSAPLTTSTRTKTPSF